MLTESEYKEHILEKMKVEIKCALTVGRTDEELEPFTESEIKKFIKKNSSQITSAVNNMYRDFLEEENLDDLIDAPLDWYREYLYDNFPELNNACEN